MNATLELPPELVDSIADKLVEKLRPLFAGNAKQSEDLIFDVPGLAEYLKVSRKWVYERTSLKEIPHIKVNGLLRFRKREIEKWLSTFQLPAVNTPGRSNPSIR